MDENTKYILTLVVTILACNGFWTFLTEKSKKKKAANTAENKALLGLLHDRIYELGNLYLTRNAITVDEYDNFLCLYEPYEELGGNGTGKKLKKEVDKLSIASGVKSNED